ncbi:hypothetical protein Tco_0411641 [Tanacetum coccineum]
MVKNDDDLRSNRGSSNLGKKVVNDVADSSNETNKVTETNKVGINVYATSIPITSNMTFIKLDDSVNADSDSEVEEVYNETKDTYDENPYDDDDFDDFGLTKTQMAFANAFYISLRGASQSSKVMPLTYSEHSPREKPGLGTIKHTTPDIQDSSREDHRTSDHNAHVASLKNIENYKAQHYQYASLSKQIVKPKAKPFPPCTSFGFNDHRPDDCSIYPKGGVLAESPQSSESLVGLSCNACASTVHSTFDHHDFDHYKRGEILQDTKAKEPTKKWVHKRN